MVYALFMPANSSDQDMGCGREPFDCPHCWVPEKKLKFWWVVGGARGSYYNTSFNEWQLHTPAS